MTAKLRRRDYILVPLTIVGTAVAMFALTEIITRTLWPAHFDETTCVLKDPLGLVRAQPNCTVKTKIPEGPWVNYTYNQCGYRSEAPCGVKPPGTLRIVFLGSSITQGFNVPYSQTFPEQAGRALARATGRRIEVQNLGFEGLSPLQCYRKVNEAIALEPDLVVYSVSPFDLEEEVDPVQLAARNNPDFRFSRPPVHFDVSPIKVLQVKLNDSRTVTMAQHLLFSNTDTYLRLSLARGDKTDYLRQPLTARWQKRFQDFNLIVNDMATHMHAAGIPLLIMAIPSHQEAALLTSRQPPPHTDPFAFGHIIQSMAAHAGVGYVDAIDGFKKSPRSDLFFYLVESHLNPQGNTVVSNTLVHKCLDGSIPAFTGASTP